MLHYVGNETKGRISKRVFQENKARQIFQKTNISYPQIRTCTWRALFSWNIRFEILPFALLPTNSDFFRFYDFSFSSNEKKILKISLKCHSAFWYLSVCSTCQIMMELFLRKSIDWFLIFLFSARGKLILAKALPRGMSNFLLSGRRWW